MPHKICEALFKKIQIGSYVRLSLSKPCRWRHFDKLSETTISNYSVIPFSIKSCTCSIERRLAMIFLSLPNKYTTGVLYTS